MRQQRNDKVSVLMQKKVVRDMAGEKREETGPAGKIRAHLYVSVDIGYINEEDFGRVYELAEYEPA